MPQPDRPTTPSDPLHRLREDVQHLATLVGRVLNRLDVLHRRLDAAAMGRVSPGGHQRHVFCGRHFCVSRAQDAILAREWGVADLRPHYRRWDREADGPVGDLFAWARERLDAHRRREALDRLAAAGPPDGAA